MSNQYDDDDELDGVDLIKDLRRQIKALSKDKNELASELESLRNESRTNSLKSILDARGVNQKVAKFIPADVVGEDAIDEWLEENADAFGIEVVTPDSGPSVNAEDVSAAQRLQSLGQTAQTPSKIQDLEARIANASSDEELANIWAEAKNFLL